MTDNWYGWAGTVLEVDLASGDIQRKPLSRDFAREYIGGSGFGVKLLYDELEPGADPLGPENIIIIGQGPLAGTAAPSSGRYEMVSKSPVTGLYLRSNGGGFFAPEMRWAGYDLIIIRGRAEQPVYLNIADDRAELRPAAGVWGLNTWDTEKAIRQELGDDNVQVLKIGPAGEKLCLTSCVIANLSNAAGRMGTGAVWGSKNLKAIAISSSRKKASVARPGEFRKLSRELEARARQDPAYELHTRCGNLAWVSDGFIKQAYGNAFSGLLSDRFQETLYGDSVGCYNCSLKCRHYYEVKEGKYKGTTGDGLHTNAVMYGGIILGINDPAFVATYNTICNQLGLNVDVPGNAIAWAMELYSRGIITKEDTDGVELTRGNEEAVLTLVDKIARKEGFGAVLDTYPLRAAEAVGRGSERYAAHVKGAPSRGTGIELSWEWTLGLAVATRGRDHLTGSPCITTPGLNEELTGDMLGKLGQERYGDPRVIAEAWYYSPQKARFVYDQENVYACHDMTGICKYMGAMCLYVSGMNYQDFASLLTAATGIDYTAEDMVRAGERQLLMERAFNAREWVRRIDDHPFPLYWKLKTGEVHPDYKYGGQFEESYERLLDEYYRLRGCELETGIPTGEKLREMGLEAIAEDLARRGIIDR
ncbi:MAG: aldehyde ferredoxin oxidoreductase family protein [Chloroflexi bacterium]|nr:aldehyde ferredoxin oxidoreductase family protein [Chloroflexota bacterium]